MWDNILDWIEDHRKLLISLLVALIIVVIMFAIRHHNLSKTVNEQNNTTEIISDVVEETSTEELTTESPYNSSFRDDNGLIVSTESNKPTKKEEKPKVIKPNFDATCTVFGHTSVPKKNVDGSSCKAYLNSVGLIDFNTFWGSALDDNDKKARTKYLVGVDQDNIDEEIADLQSVGWLISNFNKLGQHDAIKFTNLHVIGSLSNDNVAVLCSYDWYSAFGLKDTLVVFEDISGTLDRKQFTDGAIFSATVFTHNMKVVRVNGQNVVCVQYNVFK